MPKPKGLSKSQSTSNQASIVNDDELTLQIEQQQGQEEELSQFEQLKQLYNHALSTLEEEDDDKTSHLLFIGTIHECDALLKETDSQNQELPAEFHYMYAMSLIHVADSKPKKERKEYLTEALKRIAIGKKIAWVDGELCFNIALTLLYCKKAFGSKKGPSDIKIASLCFKKVAQLDENVVLPLLAQFNFYIDESQDIDEKMQWLNWILEEYTRYEKDENEFGALVGKGKAYLSCGQYYCDELEGMEVADDDENDDSIVNVVEEVEVLDSNGEVQSKSVKEIESTSKSIEIKSNETKVKSNDNEENDEEFEDDIDVPAQQLLELAAECFESALTLLKHDVDTQLMCLLGETFINLGNVLEMTNEEEGKGDEYYKKAVSIFKQVKKVGGGRVPEQFMELIESFEDNIENRSIE